MKKLQQIFFGSALFLSIILCIMAQRLQSQAPTDVMTTATPASAAIAGQAPASATTTATPPTVQSAQPTVQPQPTTVSTPTDAMSLAIPTMTAVPQTMPTMSPTPTPTTQTMTPGQMAPTSPMPTTPSTTVPPSSFGSPMPGTTVPYQIMPAPSAVAQAMAGQAMPTPTAASPAQNIGQPGIWINNPTLYPATMTLHIMPSNRIIQKDVPAGQNIALLNETLNTSDTYTVSGSLFQTIITKTTVTTLSGTTQPTQPEAFINTKTHRISSSNNWTGANLAGPNINLTLDFVENPGAEATFSIRQQ